ncbi:inorganic triphosphatase [Sphingobium lactosutens]|uniref:CYTH and CHAD domain-containing protein n=1 Tax=Sphingobium lactosutens TaxID=522773 RepID=UPI0015C0A750|nr:CHAD domain-containing protein [Sphingobium lactosutens]NWK96664.1 inorganic triphosphatase [Sphingobium lactosutens]
MGREVELKLDLTDVAAGHFAHWDALPEREDVTRLQSIYFDTPDGRLADEGVSLRIRKSGKRRIQTIKADDGGSAGLFARQEWEMPVRGTTPQPDPRTPLAAMLGEAMEQVEPVFEVDVERSRWLIADGAGRVELVLDRGVVRAGEREAPLCEIELELVDGPPATLFTLARRIDGEVPVRPGMLTKSERGYRLRSAIPAGFKAERVRLDPAMKAGEAFLRIGQACLRQYRLNEMLLLEQYDPKALHQARVAVRRLRSALSLFKPILLEVDILRFQAELRWLAGMLGEARDLDVLAARVDDAARLFLADAYGAAHRRVGEWLHSARVRMLLLDLTEWLAVGAGCGGAADELATDFAAGRLGRLRRKIRRGGRAMAKLSDDARHQIRKDAKKLRYGSEFFADLFQKPAQRRRQRKLVGALTTLQERLGDLNDLANAPGLLARHGLAADTPLGLKREKKLIAGAADAHAELAETRKYWD